jgi:pimeloyl-ACP methyl ester carboxylesterase
MTRDRRAVLIALAGIGTLYGGAPLRAAEPEFQSVSLATGDGVELAGRYAPGRLGRKSPAVIVLDDVRTAARTQACRDVASKLAAGGCAVLTVDFRGHGGSTGVTPAFWSDPTNRRLVRGYHRTRPKEAVGYADFRPGYLPALVNDVAAARAFLEKRNDAGECNAGHLFVVGFGSGATVGMLWLGSEWERYRSYGSFPEKLAPVPEGRDVAGCIWVDLSETLDRQAVPLAAAVQRAAQKNSVLFGLVHSADDRAAADLAADWARRLNDSAGRTIVLSRPVTRSETAGEAGVVTEVAKVFEAMRKVQAAAPWDDRDFEDRSYLWVRAGSRPVPAKVEGEETFRPVPTAFLFAGR